MGCLLLRTGNWWLRVGGELVGYWPGSLFTSLKDKAEEVYWGGGIANEMTGGRHTTTTMGSGHFAGDTSQGSGIRKRAISGKL